MSELKSSVHLVPAWPFWSIMGQGSTSSIYVISKELPTTPSVSGALVACRQSKVSDRHVGAIENWVCLQPDTSRHVQL